MIKQYFFKSHRHYKQGIRKGVMVAIPNEENTRIIFGISLCHFPLDSFDKKFGTDIAVARAKCDRPLKVPESMKKEFSKFKLRCTKYYKQFSDGVIGNMSTVTTSNF